MIIKFSYYNDKDFGLTAFSEIKFSEKEIVKNKKNNKLKSHNLEKKKNEYTKYLVTGIMEDFPYEEIIDDFLLKLEKIQQPFTVSIIKIQENMMEHLQIQIQIN